MTELISYKTLGGRLQRIVDRMECVINKERPALSNADVVVVLSFLLVKYRKVLFACELKSPKVSRSTTTKPSKNIVMRCETK
jgi:hypothetical protein